jgi:hypothetical protein
MHNIPDTLGMPEVLCEFSFDEGCCKGSQYLIMRKQWFIECSNINYDVMYSSIISMPFTSIYSTAVTQLIIEAISAYDEKKSKEIMDFINKLSAWLLDKENSEINRLNRLQIIKRQRVLTKEEQERLRNIIHSSEFVIFKIGACILLESFSEAKAFWDSMDEDMMEEFKTHSCFPIFNLWEQNKPELHPKSEKPETLMV